MAALVPNIESSSPINGEISFSISLSGFKAVSTFTQLVVFPIAVSALSNNDLKFSKYVPT